MTHEMIPVGLQYIFNMHISNDAVQIQFFIQLKRYKFKMCDSYWFF